MTFRDAKGAFLERPNGREGERKPLPWSRFLRRLLFAAAFLALTQPLLGLFWHPPATDFESDYRLPRNREASRMVDLVDHVRTQGVNPEPRVAVFLGSSPTWGYRVKEGSATFPASFEREARSKGVEVKAYNLASKGQFVSDQYYILKSVVDSADVFYVQLNYHTFNPATLAESPIRDPELPRRLGVPVGADEAEVLGRRPSGPLDLDRYVSGTLRKVWPLFRDADKVVQDTIGVSQPETRLFSLWEQARGIRGSDEDEAELDTKSFDDLEPEKQSVIVAVYRDETRFALKPGNSEVFYLQKMAELLKSKGKKAVFYMTPLNMEIVDWYGMIDRKVYARNVGLVRKTVEGRGQVFIDYNTYKDFPPLPATDFYDVSHTLDSGGRKFGALLADDTLGYLKERVK